MRLTSFLWYFVLLASSANAGSKVRWESTSLEYKVDVLTAEKVVKFAFTNEGAASVKVDKIKSNCWCASSPAFPKNKIKPGEKGAIQSTVDMTKVRYERESIRYMVYFDDGSEQVLKCVIERPAVVSVSAKELGWKLNSPTTEKLITIKKTDAVQSISLDTFRCTNGLTFEASLREVSADHFEIRVKPKRTTVKISAYVSFNIKFGDNKFIRKYAIRIATE